MRIDPKYAEVITLWVQGNTLSQIRDVTDLTVSAAKTRIHRARNKIRNLQSGLSHMQNSLLMQDYLTRTLWVT